MSSFSGPRRYFSNRRGGRYYKHSHNSRNSIASVFNKVIRDLESFIRSSSSTSTRASELQQMDSQGGQLSKADAGKLSDTDIKHSEEQYLGNLRVLKILGEGRFATCYLATDEKSLYALKLLKKKRYQKNPQRAKYEEAVLRALKHEAIPNFIKKIDDHSSIGFVLEYKPGINLENMVFNHGHVFTRNEIYNIGRQLIAILKYLHGKGIVHRDVRLPNVLFNNNRIYLVDFGLARWIDNKEFKVERDLLCLGDLLLHLYYTSFKDKPTKSRPWYEELSLTSKEMTFLKKLKGNEKRYRNILEVEKDFEEILTDFRLST